jgi:uncharacterized membrane protein
MKNPAKNFSPIVDAIREAESETSAEIRVHLSRRLWERNPYQRAMRLFQQYGMSGSAQRNSVLFYVNLRRKKFAIVGDEGAHTAVGQRFWEELSRETKRNMISTHPENAIALIIRKLGARLAKHFPRPGEPA